MITEEYNSPLQESASLEKDIQNGRLAARTALAMDTIMLQAQKELQKKDFVFEAEQLNIEWNETYKNSFRSFIAKMNDRDIGDHPDQVLSTWLEQQINMLIMLLGMPIMKATHLIDLKVFNDTIKIVFRPCTFGMNSVTGTRIAEYKRNFAEGAEIYGLLPVVSFWGCVAGTFSAGYAIICSPVEFIIGRFAAPRLSDIVYKKACGG